MPRGGRYLLHLGAEIARVEKVGEVTGAVVAVDPGVEPVHSRTGPVGGSGAHLSFRLGPLWASLGEGVALLCLAVAPLSVNVPPQGRTDEGIQVDFLFGNRDLAVVRLRIAQIGGDVALVGGVVASVGGRVTGVRSGISLTGDLRSGIRIDVLGHAPSRAKRRVVVARRPNVLHR